jgi:cation diffusion facilitator family transporter
MNRIKKMKEQEAIQTTYYSIILNTILALVKGVVGVLGHSYAMIADAIESTTDIFSSIIVLIGLKVSSKPADENHPYGHGKAEAIATFVVASMLIISATIIIYQSIININTPHRLPHPYTLWVLGAIILIKEGIYQFIEKKNKDIHSASLAADAWHHRSDALTSLAAFIGIAIAIYFGEGYETADDWAALLAALVIYYNSYLIMKPALGEMMDIHQYDEVILEIRNNAKDIEGIIDTEKCLVRKAGMKYLIDLHITVNGDMSVKEGHRISHLLKDHLMFKNPNISDVLIHIEPEMS